MAHIEWLTCVLNSADEVVREHKLQWPPYRFQNAIDALEVALQNYADFTSDNEKSDFSIPEMPDLCEPCED